MSRQNKVNPGTYTQRGRLTQDDAARELRKQNALGSPHTWQPVKNNAKPRPAPIGDAARGKATAAEAGQEEPSQDVEKVRPASRMTKKKSAVTSAPEKLTKTKSITATKAAVGAGRAKAAKTATKTAGRAGAAKAANPATKRAATKTPQKADVARNVGGAGPTSRGSSKRRTR